MSLVFNEVIVYDLLVSEIFIGAYVDVCTERSVFNVEVIGQCFYFVALVFKLFGACYEYF